VSADPAATSRPWPWVATARGPVLLGVGKIEATLVHEASVSRDPEEATIARSCCSTVKKKGRSARSFHTSAISPRSPVRARERESTRQAEPVSTNDGGRHRD
jgi:hypothetical protein